MQIRYKIRDGVELVRVCDVPILLADITARHFCRCYRKLDEMSGYYVELIKKGLSVDEIICQTKLDYEITDNQLFLDELEQVLDILELKGYIIKEKGV